MGGFLPFFGPMVYGSDGGTALRLRMEVEEQG